MNLLFELLDLFTHGTFTVFLEPFLLFRNLAESHINVRCICWGRNRDKSEFLNYHNIKTEYVFVFNFLFFFTLLFLASTS